MIPSGKLVAVDTETTGLRPWHGDQPFAVSFCNEQMQTGYMSWPVDPKTRRVCYEKQQQQLDELRRFLLDASITKVFHNAPFDIRMFQLGMGLEVRGRIEDTQLSTHACHTAEDDYKLKPLCKRYHLMGDADEAALKKAVIRCRNKAVKLGWAVDENTEGDYWLPAQILKSDVCREYAVNDAIRTMKLWLLTAKMLDGMGRREAYEFEMRKLYPVIREMENRGVRVDERIIKQEIQRCKINRARALKKLVALNGGAAINPNSDQQLRKLLFGKRGLRPTMFTEKTKEPSTKKDALVAYEEDEAVVALTKYRNNDKGISSFFEAYLYHKVETADGWVIHPSFIQHGKRTARLSCTSPNMQGITDTEGGRGDSDVPARRPFVPRTGCAWYLFDYNQLEVRTFAAASNDRDLLLLLESGEDLHTKATNGIWGGKDNERAIKAAMHATGFSRRKAAEWLEGFDWDIVKAEASVGKKTSRNKGKPFFFTRMFGGGKRSIAEKLGCDLEEAAELIDRYDKTLPGVIRFVRLAAAEAERVGYVTTLYGRRLDLPKDEIHKASPYIVQGTAADLVKRALLACYQYLQQHPDVDAHLLLQIHDELIFEIREPVDDDFLLGLKAKMETEEEYVRTQMTSKIRLAFPCKIKRAAATWDKPEPWTAKG